jgi:hypothetical protein
MPDGPLLPLPLPLPLALALPLGLLLPLPLPLPLPQLARAARPAHQPGRSSAASGGCSVPSVAGLQVQ